MFCQSTTTMREKHSFISPLFVIMLLCIAFQPCRSEDDKSLYNIHLKLERMETKIDALQKREMYLTEITDRQQSTILELQTTVTKQQQTINQHQEKIVDQEEDIRQHDSLLSDIQNREHKHKDVIAKLKRTVMTQNRQVKLLLGQLGYTEKKLESSVKVQSGRISMPVKASGPSKSSQKQMGVNPFTQPHDVLRKRLVLNYEGPIAFTTTLTKQTDHIGLNQNIVFDNVVLNLGNGYHNLHGIFIVPRNGLYVFSANLMFDDKNHINADAAIALNGQDIVRLYARGDSGSWDHASQTVVLQANQGDEVWVRNINFINTSVYGSKYSSFSGYLLYEV